MEKIVEGSQASQNPDLVAGLVLVSIEGNLTGKKVVGQETMYRDGLAIFQQAGRPVKLVFKRGSLMGAGIPLRGLSGWSVATGV
eukprot:SAG11_NODE_1444_length_4893_cov_7.649979_4_plen_84_part_00